MDNETKSIFLSKTMWVNLLTVMIIIINRYGVVIEPELIEPLAIVILPIANMLLRTVTDKPVSLGGK